VDNHERILPHSLKEDIEMYLRIIAGKARGTRLQVPNNKELRPTTERVRAALFSILFPRLQGGTFLDLYAGTGANGIEALSRGASAAVFIEKDKEALSTIEINLARAGFSGNAHCVLGSVPEALRQAARLYKTYDIIFADPPYGSPELTLLPQWVTEYEIFKSGGLLVIEHTSKDRLPDLVEGSLRLLETRNYGTSSLSFFA